MFWGRVLNF